MPRDDSPPPAGDWWFDESAKGPSTATAGGPLNEFDVVQSDVSIRRELTRSRRSPLPLVVPVVVAVLLLVLMLSNPVLGLVVGSPAILLALVLLAVRWRRPNRLPALRTWTFVTLGVLGFTGVLSSAALGTGSSPAPNHPRTAAAAPSATAAASAPIKEATPVPSAAAVASSPPSAPAAAGTALAVLATLPTKGRAPMTGYARTADFGAAWLDVNRNGCDTRNDILRRDLRDISATGCRVLAGVLRDPYTGRIIDFTRGVRTSLAVQIDHMVALGDAWQTGAQQLSEQQRIELANDPINLMAVDGPTNEQKSDADAASWLPPNKSFRCEYVAHQIGVKKSYHLWVTSAERAAMQRVLAKCPSVPAPTSKLATGF